MLHHIQQLQDGQNVFANEEKILMMILDLVVQYPNLQVKIFNRFDKLAAMIHIQLNDGIISETSLSHCTIERIIHDCLKITSCWVPHQLTDEQRVKLSRENLTKFQNGS